MTSSSFLFPECRRRVLSLLLLHPDIRYHLREIARLTNTAPGTLHRELVKLTKEKIFLREASGQQVYYQANRTFPIFEELASILRKTSGLADILADALAPLAEKIELAFVFGSAARGAENMGSDVDILIVGEIGYTEAVTALYPAQNIIQREINPKVYNANEWQKSVNNKGGFIQDILKKPKLFIIGKNDDFR